MALQHNIGYYATKIQTR